MQNIDLGYITDNGLSENMLIQFYVDKKDTVKELVAGAECMNRIEAAITGSSSEVNGYCLTRYSDQFPWDPVPELVQQITLDVFKYRAYSRRGNIDESIAKLYKNAENKLEKIQEGKIKLEFENEETQEQGQVPENRIRFTNKTPADRVFRNPPGYLT